MALSSDQHNFLQAKPREELQAIAAAYAAFESKLGGSRFNDRQTAYFRGGDERYDLADDFRAHVSCLRNTLIELGLVEKTIGFPSPESNGSSELVHVPTDLGLAINQYKETILSEVRELLSLKPVAPAPAASQAVAAPQPVAPALQPAPPPQPTPQAVAAPQPVAPALQPAPTPAPAASQAVAAPQPVAPATQPEPTPAPAASQAVATPQPVAPALQPAPPPQPTPPQKSPLTWLPPIRGWNLRGDRVHLPATSQSDASEKVKALQDNGIDAQVSDRTISGRREFLVTIPSSSLDALQQKADMPNQPPLSQALNTLGAFAQHWQKTHYHFQDAPQGQDYLKLPASRMNERQFQSVTEALGLLGVTNYTVESGSKAFRIPESHEAYNQICDLITKTTRQEIPQERPRAAQPQQQPVATVPRAGLFGNIAAALGWGQNQGNQR